MNLKVEAEEKAKTGRKRWMFLLSSYSMLQDILPVINQTNAIYSRLTIIVKTDYSANPCRTFTGKFTAYRFLPAFPAEPDILSRKLTSAPRMPAFFSSSRRELRACKFSRDIPAISTRLRHGELETRTAKAQAWRIGLSLPAAFADIKIAGDTSIHSLVTTELIYRRKHNGREQNLDEKVHSTGHRFADTQRVSDLGEPGARH
jgi:hypothetical protein